MNLGWNPVVWEFIHYQATNLNGWGIFEPSLHTEASLHCKKYVGVMKLREAQKSFSGVDMIAGSSQGLWTAAPWIWWCNHLFLRRNFCWQNWRISKALHSEGKIVQWRSYFSSVFFLSLYKLNFNLLVWEILDDFKIFWIQELNCPNFITNFSRAYFLDARVLPVLPNGMQHHRSGFHYQSYPLYVPHVSSLQKVV